MVSHSGTVWGQVFLPRERALETTFRPDRAPVSGTVSGLLSPLSREPAGDYFSTRLAARKPGRRPGSTSAFADRVRKPPR